MKTLNQEEILLKKVPFATPRVKEIPKYGYIYFLIKEDTIIYVGQAKNYISRIREHARPRYPLFYKDFDSYSIIKVPYSKIKKIEQKYIRTFKPIRNIQCNG